MREPLRHRSLEEVNLLSGRHLITLATLGGVQIHAADQHRQRHAVDFDHQRSGVPAAGNLETPPFQPLDLGITMPPFACVYRILKKAIGTSRRGWIWTCGITSFYGESWVSSIRGAL
jgi:hypothetical protein